MQTIQFSDDQYAQISDRAAAAGYADVAAFLASLASADKLDSASDRVKTGGVLPTLPDRIDAAGMIREQGVKPITDFRSLKGDFYPAGETSEEFLQTIEERRNLDAPAAG